MNNYKYQVKIFLDELNFPQCLIQIVISYAFFIQCTSCRSRMDIVYIGFYNRIEWQLCQSCYRYANHLRLFLILFDKAIDKSKHVKFSLLRFKKEKGFHCMLRLPEKKINETWIWQTTDGTILSSCSSFQEFIHMYNRYIPHWDSYSMILHINKSCWKESDVPWTLIKLETNEIFFSVSREQIYSFDCRVSFPTRGS